MNHMSTKNISLEAIRNNSSSKLRDSIKQKDVLIKSLKGTIDNLTNVICNNSNKILELNECINSEIRNEIDSTFADQYFRKMENYIKEINELRIQNNQIKEEFENISINSRDSEKSYNILNSIYLEYIKKTKGEKQVLFERITNLGKTMDSLKEINENKVKNLRSYYQREIDKASGIKCTKCWKNNVTTVFLPCNHMVFCNECIDSLKNEIDPKLKCPRCQEYITSQINVEF